jgi:hypothetical protein
VDAEDLRPIDCYREALARAEAVGMRPLVAHCHLSLGKLCRHANDEQSAREHLAAAAALYRQMHMQGSLKDVEGIEA